MLTCTLPMERQQALLRWVTALSTSSVPRTGRFGWAISTKVSFPGLWKMEAGRSRRRASHALDQTVGSCGNSTIKSAAVSIDDCYALTLDGFTLWCCPYTDFPIVKVERDEVRRWRNKVAGARALAVEGDLVLLAGGYGDQAERIALLRLGDDQAHQIGKWQFQRSDRNAARLLQGRGETLHI